MRVSHPLSQSHRMHLHHNRYAKVLYHTAHCSLSYDTFPVVIQTFESNFPNGPVHATNASGKSMLNVEKIWISGGKDSTTYQTVSIFFWWFLCKLMPFVALSL